MLDELKLQVYLANLELVKRNLVILTWGNVSAFDIDSGLVVIKPSGVDYDKMSANDMVVVNLDGNTVEGKYKPSCDTPTHIELYKAYPNLKGIVHTHSTYATAFAQAGLNIPAYGTTHADYFHGDILCTRQLSSEEVASDYEKNTGKVIIETLKNYNLSEHRGILVKNHGVFSWGNSPIDAVNNAQALDKMAEMAFITRVLSSNAQSVLPQYVLDKHYNRKHGKNAYYGQKDNVAILQKVSN